MNPSWLNLTYLFLMGMWVKNSKCGFSPHVGYCSVNLVKLIVNGRSVVVRQVSPWLMQRYGYSPPTQTVNFGIVALCVHILYTLGTKFYKSAVCVCVWYCICQVATTALEPWTQTDSVFLPSCHKTHGPSHRWCMLQPSCPWYSGTRLCTVSPCVVGKVTPQ